MIRGIHFEIPRNKIGNNLLRDILKGIDIKQYYWRSISNQNEVWASFEPDAGDFFEKDYYTGKDFDKHIQLFHYIIFLKLQAYFPGGKYSDIHTYEEFQNSDCQLLLLVYDNRYIDIYIKDQDALKTMYDSAIAQRLERVKYLTPISDGRTGMDLL